MKLILLGPTPNGYDSVVLEWGLRTYISKSQGNAEIDVQQDHFENHLLTNSIILHRQNSG